MIKMSNIAGNKRLSSDFKTNFENINKININIAGELEKRAAFSEECAKIMLNENADFSTFVSMLENEKSKINFSNVKKNIIDENIFLCEYIFKSINFSDLFSAYSAYISENPADLNNLDDKINIKINLTEKFNFNSFIQYMAIFDFDIVNLNYENNDVSLVLKTKDKENLFAVFCGLLEYIGNSFKIKEGLVINNEKQ